MSTQMPEWVRAAVRDDLDEMDEITLRDVPAEMGRSLCALAILVRVACHTTTVAASDGPPDGDRVHYRVVGGVVDDVSVAVRYRGAAAAALAGAGIGGTFLPTLSGVAAVLLAVNIMALLLDPFVVLYSRVASS